MCMEAFSLYPGLAFTGQGEKMHIGVHGEIAKDITYNRIRDDLQEQFP